MSKDVYYCPYDILPCGRYDANLGFGVCEVTRDDVSDVCPRFVLKPNSAKLVEFWNKKQLGEVVVCRRRGFEDSEV